ncbi:hypothetical protein ACFRDV_14675 [Streptomyces fagopyri]|uniref:hypothetical protein n=1 Tax=Streptomyces fagopyri TaxID=2662397 RepID=UPI00369BCA02
MIKEIDAGEVAQVTQQVADEPPCCLVGSGTRCRTRVETRFGEGSSDVTQLTVRVIDRVLRLPQQPHPLPGQGNRILGPPGRCQ